MNSGCCISCYLGASRSRDAVGIAVEGVWGMAISQGILGEFWGVSRGFGSFGIPQDLGVEPHWVGFLFGAVLGMDPGTDLKASRHGGFPRPFRKRGVLFKWAPGIFHSSTAIGLDL